MQSRPVARQASSVYKQTSIRIRHIGNSHHARSSNRSRSVTKAAAAAEAAALGDDLAPAPHHHHQHQQPQNPPADLDRLLTSRAYTPPRPYVGPIAVAAIPGRRLGLVAARDIALGEPLLVSPRPLVALLGPAGAPPGNAELTGALAGRALEPEEAAWLALLARGAGVGGGGAGVKDDDAAAASADADEAAMLLDGNWRPAAGSDDDAAAATTTTTTTNLDALAAVVAATAYAEVREDAVAAALKELAPEGVAGVWPEFALLNHSCAPNAVAVPFGTVLVVRAARSIAQGTEVTTCYLGAARLAPVRTRRAALRAQYGFHCQCDRCLAEQRGFPTNWYPQDAAELGLEDEEAGGGNNSSSGVLGVVRRAALSLVQFVRGRGGGNDDPRRPAPSPDHRALLELSELAAPGGPLAGEVQAAAAAPGARSAAPRRAAALAQTAEARARLEAAIAAMPRAPTARELRWLRASAFGVLQLEADALALALAGGAPLTAADLAAAESRGRQRNKGAAAAAAQHQQRWGGGGGGSDEGAGDDSNEDAAVRAALREHELDTLRAAADALDGVARGSERHLELALAALDAARALRGAGSPEARAAETALGRAHAARYGALAPDLLRKAVAARRRMLLGARLARRMDVLAWDGAAAADDG